MSDGLAVAERGLKDGTALLFSWAGFAVGTSDLSIAMPATRPAGALVHLLITQKTRALQEGAAHCARQEVREAVDVSKMR
jgi:hypothetical protein